MVAPPTEATMRLEERQPGDGRSEQAMTPERAKRAPQGGPSVASRREAESLSGGLLCDRSAEFERPVFFPATRYQSDNGAKERHGCDFLGHGDPHHCHERASISSPPGRPQHGIVARCYFVQLPVRRGHGAQPLRPMTPPDKPPSAHNAAKTDQSRLRTATANGGSDLVGCGLPLRDCGKNAS
jgi:hypothetical protein